MSPSVLPHSSMFFFSFSCRACVQLDIDCPYVECLGWRGDHSLLRRLHVQSVSRWAPACIGPYAQAVSLPDEGMGGLTVLSGQIPLDPASMRLDEQASVLQCAQCCWGS